MGRISELKRYRSILAILAPRDITDTLSVDHDEQNSVEYELSCTLKLPIWFDRKDYCSDDAVIMGITGSCCPGSSSCSNSRLALSIFG